MLLFNIPRERLHEKTTYKLSPLRETNNRDRSNRIAVEMFMPDVSADDSRGCFNFHRSSAINRIDGHQ